MTREPYWQNVYERGLGARWFNRGLCVNIVWEANQENLGRRIAMVKVTPKPGAKL